MIRWKNTFIKQNMLFLKHLIISAFILSGLFQNKQAEAQYQLLQRLEFSSFLFHQKKYSLYITEIHDISNAFSPTLLPSEYGFYLAFSYFQTNQYDSIFSFDKNRIFKTYNQRINSKLFAIKKAVSITGRSISKPQISLENKRKNPENEFIKFLKLVDSLQIHKTIQESIVFRNKGLQASYNRLLYASEKYNAYNPKSPVIAGVLSALVPGTGKIYAGRPKECLVPLGETLALSLVAFEGYRKDDLHSPQLYIFGGLCALFYIANIYGSAKAVIVSNAHVTEELHKIISEEVNRSINYLLDY